LHKQAINNTEIVISISESKAQNPQVTALIDQLKKHGWTIRLETVETVEFSAKLLPSRSFQAAIIGLDYGFEIDPVYFWHSSQIRPPGNNITGVKLDEIDAQIEVIRTTNDIKEKIRLLNEFHAKLTEMGIIKILSQDEAKLFVSDDIRFEPPPLINNIYDHLITAMNWSVR